MELDGDGLLAGLGQSRDKGSHGQYVGRQRFAAVLAALSGEALPVSSVSALGVGRALLAGGYLPRARCLVLVDVANRADCGKAKDNR